MTTGKFFTRTPVLVICHNSGWAALPDPHWLQAINSLAALPVWAAVFLLSGYIRPFSLASNPLLSLKPIFKNHLSTWETQTYLYLLLILCLCTLHGFSTFASIFPVKTGGTSQLGIQSCTSEAEIFHNQS